MKIRKLFDPVERRQVICDATDKPVYEFVFDKETGEKTLKAVKKTNFHQRIQDAAVGVSLMDYIKRYERLRDPEILASLADTSDSFVDLVGMPTDVLDYAEKLDKAKNLFDKLPSKYKQVYDNDRAAFTKALFSGDVSIFDDFKKEEVKSDGSDA